jgi:hypothetical protein
MNNWYLHLHRNLKYGLQQKAETKNLKLRNKILDEHGRLHKESPNTKYYNYRRA